MKKHLPFIILITCLFASCKTQQVSTAKGQPQRYGTQCYWDENGTHFSPIADTLRLDSLRASVGLCPMAEYALQMRAEWNP